MNMHFQCQISELLHLLLKHYRSTKLFYILCWCAEFPPPHLVLNLISQYLPSGQLAAILQVYNGTKHRRFPRFLDVWLKCRKQLGLLAFLLGVIHAIMSLALMNSNYMRSWYHPTGAKLPGDILDTLQNNSTQTDDFIKLKVQFFLSLSVSICNRRL